MNRPFYTGLGLCAWLGLSSVLGPALGRAQTSAAYPPSFLAEAEARIGAPRPVPPGERAGLDPAYLSAFGALHGALGTGAFERSSRACSRFLAHGEASAAEAATLSEGPPARNPYHELDRALEWLAGDRVPEEPLVGEPLQLFVWSEGVRAPSDQREQAIRLLYQMRLSEAEPAWKTIVRAHAARGQAEVDARLAQRREIAARVEAELRTRSEAFLANAPRGFLPWLSPNAWVAGTPAGQQVWASLVDHRFGFWTSETAELEELAALHGNALAYSSFLIDARLARAIRTSDLAALEDETLHACLALGARDPLRFTQCARAREGASRLPGFEGRAGLSNASDARMETGQRALLNRAHLLEGFLSDPATGEPLFVSFLRIEIPAPSARRPPRRPAARWRELFAPLPAPIPIPVPAGGGRR